MSDLRGTATVSLAELAGTDLDGSLDVVSDRAFADDSHRAVGLECRIVGHTADSVTLAVTADIDPLVTEW
ncbi:MAG: hypothetical protein PHQ28_00350 [Mycobacterium sp.]|nr:hypothetical protein [Mycobacterium sp.]